MTTTRRALLVAALPFPAGAAGFATRPVKILVSAAAGASLDILARAIAPGLGQALGQPVVVENQGGAGGLVAMQQVARMAPDGHTLLLTGDALVTVGAMQRDAGVDAVASFAPVTLAVRAAQILVTHPGTGIADVRHYVARVKAAPGTLNMGLPGWGGIAHLINEMLNRQLGLRVEYIPYRGGAPAALDLLARQVDAIIITLPAVTEQVREGRLIGLAVSTARRDPALPEVPSLAETVAPGFDVESFQGVLAPAGTPAAVVAELHAGISAALALPAVKARLTELGYEIVAAGPAPFAQRIAVLGERFGQVIREAGITAR